MLNDICFYSHFGNGDLFNSREIIKWIIREHSEYNYYYAHAKDHRIFCDIPELVHSPIHPFMRGDKAFIVGGCNDLYINTWIGRDSNYVLQGIGCTLHKYIQMFNDVFIQLNKEGINFKHLPQASKIFLPKVKFSTIENYGRIRYIMDTLVSKYTYIVLLCTGDVWSNQAENFDMKFVAKYLAKKFPNLLFLTTTYIKSDFENLLWTENITKLNSDLIQISYISTFCKIIVGRSSGPYVFTQVEENLDDPSKTFISFTKHINASQLAPDVITRSNKIWSPDSSPRGVALRIEQEIKNIEFNEDFRRHSNLW
jgi:hypothetical protein